MKLKVFAFGVFFVLLLSAVPAHAQTLTPFQVQEVKYDLPYPGILPDSPFYFLKEIRDSFRVLIARQPEQKIELYQDMADKNMSAAQELSKKGKLKQSLSQIELAQKDTSKIIGIIKSQKKLSEQAKTDSIDHLLLANQKYINILETMMKDTPTGQTEHLEELRNEGLKQITAIQKLQK